MSAQYIIPENEYNHHNSLTLGTLVHDLSLLKQHSIPVLSSFVISKDLTKHFFETDDLAQKISDLLSQVNILRTHDLEVLSRDIQHLIKKSKFSDEISQEIVKAHAKLGTELVQVSISLTRDDLPEVILNNQKSHILKAKGDANLLESIKQIWSNYFTPEAIAYRYRRNIPHDPNNMSLLVEAIPEIESSGILYTIDEVNQRQNMINIEAVWGLPDNLLQGKSDPDFYQVEKFSWRIDQKHHHHQLTQVPSSNPFSSQRLWRKKDQIKLQDDEIRRLAQIGHSIHQIHFFGQKVMWYKSANRFFIARVTPIQSEAIQKVVNTTQDKAPHILVHGEGLSEGVVSGIVKPISNQKDLASLRETDILLTKSLDDSLATALSKVSGIITYHGGQAAYIASLARSKNIPVIKIDPSKKLKEGTKVTLDGATGNIFEGKHDDHLISQKSQTSLSASKHQTKLMTFLTTFPQTPDWQNLLADGVVTDNRENLSKLCQDLGEREVIYRMQASETEIDHQSPFKYSGTWRLLDEKRWFDQELKQWEITHRTYTNLQLCLPLVRYIQEVTQAKKLIAAHNLHREDTFKLWCQIGTPHMMTQANLIKGEDIEGVVLDLDQLISLSQGVELSEEKFTNYVDYNHDSILKMVEVFLVNAKKATLKVLIVSSQPEMPKQLAEVCLKFGIYGVVTNSENLESTGQQLLAIEKQLHLQ